MTFNEIERRRFLTQDEIGDIIECCIIRSKVLPLTIADSNFDNIQRDIRKQLQSIEIYPCQIVKLKNEISKQFKASIMQAGEAVGTFAAGSLGEPLTQGTLNTFHSAGASSLQQQVGLPRFKVLLDLSKTLKKNVIQIELRNDIKSECIQQANLQNVNPIYVIRERVKQSLEYRQIRHWCISHKIMYIGNTNFNNQNSNQNGEFSEDELLLQNDFQIVESIDSYWYKLYELYTDFTNRETMINRQEQWLIRLTFDKNCLYQYKTSLSDIAQHIEKHYPELECIYSPDLESIIDVYVDVSELKSINAIMKDNGLGVLNCGGVINDANKAFYFCRDVVVKSLMNIHLNGIKGIETCYFKKIKNEWQIDLQGHNMSELLACGILDHSKTISSSVWEIYNILGIEAAREFLIQEFDKAISTYINPAHFQLPADAMTFSGRPLPVSRYGVKRNNTSCIAKASFEQPLDNFLQSACKGDLDRLNNVSASVIVGQQIRTGTGMFKLALDLDAYDQ